MTEEKTTKKPNHYVDNKELYTVMCHYKAQVEQFKRGEIPEPKIPRYVGQAIIQISTNLAVRPNYSGYTYKDEMIADAIENCVAAVKSFDPDKTNNPFAYFTMVAWNAFIRRIAKEKRQSYIKHKNLEVSNLIYELENEGVTVVSGNEYSHEVIKSYEAKLAEKSKKRAPVGLEKLIDESAD